MSEVYFSIGTNLGNKKENIYTAIKYIEKQIGKIISESALHITEPWGFSSSNNFINAALEVETDLSPQEILSTTQKIESRMGRSEKSSGHRYKDRLIDIDILLYDNLLIDDKDLIIPHPLMTKRLFVMQPLSEIAPNLIHPRLHKSIKELLISLQR